MLPGISAIRRPASRRIKTLSEILSGLTLTANLKLCLDATDINSYDPAIQTAKWLDTSGLGCDFYRGTSTPGDSAEPTFNGTPGHRSLDEFFSFDGGDYLTYDTTNEAWMNSMHKDSALFSWLCWINFGTDADDQGIFGTSGSVADYFRNPDSGVSYYFNNASGTKTLEFVAFSNEGGHGEGDNIAYQDSLSAAGITPGNWYCIYHSVDEAGNVTGRGFNGGFGTNACTYDYPSPSEAPYVMQIGALGNTYHQISAGTKLAMFSMWAGRALTQAEFLSIWNATKTRFGIS